MNAQDKPNNWGYVIEPQTSGFRLNLGELWRYRHLIAIFVRRDFVAVYKQTIFGPIWLVLPPLLTTFVFTIVFGNLAGLSTNGLPRILFYMSGIVLWGYFNGCVMSTATTFASQSGLFSKVYFPRLTVPISTIISASISSCAQFTMFCAFLAYYWVTGQIPGPGAAVVLLPILILMAGALALGIGLIASAVTTKYRDLTFLIGFGMQLWMYGTTIIYPLSSVPAEYQLFAVLNPMSGMVETFRYAVTGVGAIPMLGLAYAAAASCLVFLAGVVVFNYVERTAMDII